MTEATSITVRQLSNVGQDMLWEIKATATDGETITIPSTVPVNTTSKIKIVSANNITDGTTFDGALSVTYDDANKQFTFNESGASDEEVRIEFRIVNARD